MMKRATGRP